MQVRTVLIEQNPDLRRHLTEAIRQKGLTLAGTYEHASESLYADLSRLQPELVIFPLKQGHARHWRLVRTLRELPEHPVLLALLPFDSPAIRQSALENGVDYVFDPLLDLEGLLDALQQVREPVAERQRELVR